MNTPHQTGSPALSAGVQPSPVVPSTPWLAGKLSLAVGLTLLAGVLSSSAANITMTATDAGGTTSFNTAGHWSNLAAPSAGNAYVVSGATVNSIVLRTPNPTSSGNNYIFAGDSLSIDFGGTLLGKIGNNTGGSAYSDTITVNNLILNGGWLRQADVNNDSSILVVAGNVNVLTASTVAAIGATSSGGVFNTLEFTAPISGSAALQVSGSSINSGDDTGVVKLSAANSYSGTITVSNKLIASTVNRLLQLNHLDAAKFAVLNLSSVLPNPVSFTSEANTGIFNVGALTGKASQTLLDTAGSPVTLRVGANITNITFAGALTDAGSLVKWGNGTQTLAGTNTYTGDTTISGGTLALAATGSLSNSPNITVGRTSCTFDVSANNFILGASQSLFGSGTIVGPFGTAAGAKIYAGPDGAYGTNTFAGNLTLTAGALVCLDLGATYNGANDLITVGGNLVLNSTTFHLKAPDTSANLDTTADYSLMTVTGTVSGNPAATPIWDVSPANAANYSIILSGKTIKLHYTTSAPPTGYGSVSPDTVTRNQPTFVSVTVASSSHSISSVSLDASSLGGSSTLLLRAAGGGVYTNTVTASASVAPGLKTLIATITDSTSLSGTTPSFNLTVNPANQVWTGGGANNNWSTNPNWSSGAAPGYAGDSLTFAGSVRLAPSLEANYSVTDITFDGSASSFVIGSTASALTLTGSGVVNNSGSEQTINVPITTAAATTFNASSGNLTLGRGLTNGGNLVTVTGGGLTTINGAVSDAGGLYNSGGNLVLKGTNTFTGGIYINGGTLQLAGAGLLGGGNYAGNITNAGTFQYSSSAAQTLSGVISFYGLTKDGSGTLSLAGANTYSTETIINSGVLQISGAGSLGGGSYSASITDNGTFRYSSTAAQTLSGSISGTGGVVKDGSGTLTLNGGNSYEGATIVAGGTLVLNPATVGYSTFSTLSVSNGSLTVNAGYSSTVPVGSLSLNNNASLNFNYDFSSGNPVTAAINAMTSLSLPGTNLTININGQGAVVGQFPLLSYAGAPLPNLNKFTLGSLPAGATATLVNNTANNSIDLNITAQAVATWVQLTGSDALGNSSFNTAGFWSDAAAPSAASGYTTKAFTLRTPADKLAYTFAGAVLNLDPGGRFLLKGQNGQIITVNNLVMAGGVMDFANDADSFTETLAGDITLQSGVTSYMGALANGPTETLVVTAPIHGGGDLQFGGANVNTGQSKGTVVLAGTNTYTGTTTVSLGNLLVNGSLGNTPVTVSTNTILGGNGRIGGPVTVLAGGKLSPGIPAIGALTASLGTLTVANPVTLAGTLQLRLNRASVTNSDRLAATSVFVNPGATLTVTNLSSTSLAVGDTFTLFSTPVSGTFGTLNLPALPTGLGWTNKLAVDGTLAVFYAAGINPNPTNIVASISGGNLVLSWPLSHTGWLLQVQTNSLGAGLGTNWVDVPGSTTVNSFSIPIPKTNAAVFYRLKL